MAKFVVTATQLTLATVAYQAQLAEATLTIDVAELDATNMASGGYTEPIGGLKSGSLAVTFKKDSDLSGLDAAMFAANGTVIAFTLKQTAAAISTSNPEYQGFVFINGWTPIAGKVGDLNEASYTWKTSGAIVRDVTP